MDFLCAAATAGGSVSLLVGWPILGAAALLTAPFCGSMAAGGAALIIARRARAPGPRQDWVEGLESGTNAFAANDGAEALLRPRRFA